MTHDRDGRILRMLVYVALVLSAGAVVLFGDTLWSAVRGGYLPIWAPLLAPAAFTAFVIVYTADRLHLVRRRNYPVQRALFQVAFALVFLTLLLPQQATELRQAKREDAELKGPALLLLQQPDEQVRAAACELLQGRVPADVIERLAALSHTDPARSVRVACQHALERVNPAPPPEPL